MRRMGGNWMICSRFVLILEPILNVAEHLDRGTCSTAHIKQNSRVLKSEFPDRLRNQQVLRKGRNWEGDGTPVAPISSFMSIFLLAE
jgi:hypothetical protein